MSCEWNGVVKRNAKKSIFFFLFVEEGFSAYKGFSCCKTVDFFPFFYFLGLLTCKEPRWVAVSMICRGHGAHKKEIYRLVCVFTKTTFADRKSVV